MIEALSRAAGLVEGLFESLPQSIIQGYNNHVSQNWTYFTVVSLAISFCSFLYTFIKLAYALDRMGYYEEKTLQKQK